jgi:hypothetical protein
MSNIRPIISKVRSAHLTPMKLVQIIGAIVIVISAALIEQRPSEMISNAKASEARSIMVSTTISEQQKSWSDEWYEIHKATPDRVSEDLQAF